LTQPSPRRPGAPPRDQVDRLDLGTEVREVPLRPRDVPARADDPREVLALVDPAGVAADPASAHEQRPGVAVGQRLLLATSSGTAPWASRPMWQCASTRPGTTQPSATVVAPRTGSYVTRPW
jgi:hypothetical protein